MTHRYHFQPSLRLSLLTLSLWATTTALAQTAPTATISPEKPPTGQKAQTAPDKFQSALTGYKPYTEEKTGNWKEANETTARIGGWRAYAKEAAQTEPDPHARHAQPTQTGPTQAKP